MRPMRFIDDPEQSSEVFPYAFRLLVMDQRLSMSLDPSINQHLDEATQWATEQFGEEAKHTREKPYGRWRRHGRIILISERDDAFVFKVMWS